MGIRRLTTSNLDNTSSDFKDPIIHVNSNASGENTTDIGFLLDRGSSGNIGIIWDESANEVVLIETSANAAAEGNITISKYANLSVDKLSIANSTIQFPTSDGTDGQVLTTDGNGNLSFASVSGGSGADLTGNIDLGTDDTNTITFNGLVDSDIIPSANVTYNLGNATNRWQDLFLAGNTIDLGGAKIQTDTDSGAVAILPKPTANVANPKGIVFAGDGTVKPVETTAGAVSQENFTAAASSSATAAAVAVYANVADIPVSNVSAGSQAFVTSNNKLYINSGSGWFAIATVNQTPTISGNEAAYMLAIDGTATTVTLTGTDPEGFPITWSAVTSGDTDVATVTNTDNVFTITPSTDIADAGTLTVTFRASDGVNIGTATSEFTLVFASPYWKNTVLSIETTDVDGADNNTFLDSSTNAHTITRNGNVTQGSFSPFSQDEGKWGNYFDTSGDSLTIPYDSTLALGTGDCTIEAWIYLNSYPQQFNNIIDVRDASYGSDSISFSIESDGTFNFYAGAYSSSTHVLETASGAVTLNSWYHVVLTRVSGTTKLYVNGVEEASSTNAWNQTSGSATTLYIGNASVSRQVNGYISNVRIVKGTAVYTSAFTPPTEPLTDITNTSLLTCQSNRFVDNSSNAHSITVNGDTKVVLSSPFAQSTAYDPATKGGSGYFGGGINDTNYVKINDAAGILSGDDFQLELWTYIEDDTIENWWVDDGGGDRFLLYADVNGTTLEWHPIGLNVADPVRKNEWTHLCVSRISGTTRLFKQGKLIGSDTGDTTQFAMNNTFIGFNTGASADRVEGYVSDFSITVGSATRTADFAVPTAPLGQVGQETYLEFTNAGIYDGTGRNVLETVGDASTSTTQTKFADTAMYFDGSGDYLEVPASEQLAMGTGDFTLEFWYYEPSGVSGNRTIFESRSSAGSTDGFQVQRYDTTNIRAYSSLQIVSGSLPSQNSWNHYAVTRESGTARLFINGVLTDTSSNSQDFTNTSLLIGDNANTSQPLNGYIENLQILKGVAKYTTNFTPPNRTQGISYQAES